MENKEFEIEETVSSEENLTVEEPVTEKYVDRASLNIEDECIRKIMYKPMSTLILGVVFAAGFILIGQLATILLGLFILGLVAFVQVVVKDYPTLEIYKDYVLIYKLQSLNLVRKVMYEDIDEWTSKDSDGKSNTIYFKLKNGESIYKDTFQSAKAYSELKKLIYDKESRVVQHRKMVEKNKKMKSKFRFKLPFKWPFGKN